MNFEGALEQMNERLGGIENDIAGLRGEMGDLRKELHTNFRWTMGTVIVMWVTIICTVIFV